MPARHGLTVRMARTKAFDENEVLKKAVFLFWEKGFAGTSLPDLINGLGISRSSLYDTFGDKHQLYLKALKSYKNTYGDHVSALTQECFSAKDAVAALLTMVINSPLKGERPRGCFMVNASIELGDHDSQVNTLVFETEKQLERTFLKLILKGQEDGEISKDKNAPALARFLNITVKGLQVSAKSTTEPLLFEEVVRVAVTVLD